MGKIRFIEPRRNIESPYTPYLKRWPLMGPVILGTILENRGHDVRVYNENLCGSLLSNPKVLADFASADYVGISIMTSTASRGYALADSFRRLSPRARIIFGGVHATFCPDEAIQHGDYVVRGEGENVIEGIVDGKLSPGIVQGIPVESLDSLPLPKYELIYDYERLWEEDGGREFYRAPLITSRGCPHDCDYCSVAPMFGRRYRFRTAAKVVADIHQLYDRGFRGLFFYDDNFTAQRERVKRILCDVRHLGLMWNAQTRLDFAWEDPKRRTRCDAELLGLMRRSGGDVLYVGYETIDDQTAREWHKGYKGEGSLSRRSAEDTALLHDAGFWIHGMFVAGPQHDGRTMDRIVNFAHTNRIETMQISALTPFPGTALFDRFREKLIFTGYPTDWDFYDGLHAVYHHTRMGVQSFQSRLVDAHRQFYRGSWMYLNRMRKLFRGPGSPVRKARHMARWVRLSNQMFGAWEKQTRRFLAEVKTRNNQALFPA
jgi:anaerobic magnesium-protoporphyrin IX monomethyl ester cyclase